MKIYRINAAFLLCLSLILFLSFSASQSQAQDTASQKISINVSYDHKIGPMNPIWARWGYDEPNYTYMTDGRKLLTEMAELSPVPVYVRAHNLLTTDKGTFALKWGSTNAYTEDSQGNPVYDWTIIDQIFDTYIERGMKPIAQIGFMPEALSVKPEPYRHYWKPGAKYDEIFTGWAYPPKDYKKWSELVYQWVRHSIDRYGETEVKSWYWELWNEPNIGYWRGTMEEYFKLYDYTADAVKRALPEAKIGGPETTGPGWDEAAKFLSAFLEHVQAGKNYATGKTGSPLDFITFHAKGSPKLVDGIVQMNMGTQLRDISKGFEIIASFPALKNLPVIIGESDPEGCAACSEADYPQNAYRNGTMYSSYTAASFARVYELADHFEINLAAAVTWGFEFENQPWFAGFRDMATHGVDKPVLNVFRMFGLMQGERLKVSGNTDYDFVRVRDESVGGKEPDVNALAAGSKNTASIMLWNYYDKNQIDLPSTPVELTISGIPADKILLHHYRIDQEFSNSYSEWKNMGSPQNPTEAQITQLEKAGQLQLYSSPEWMGVKDGKISMQISLPRQAVSLVKLTW